jgi:hypothetical protein
MVLDWERHSSAKENKSLEVILRPDSRKRGDEKNFSNTVFMAKEDGSYFFSLSHFLPFF